MQVHTEGGLALDFLAFGLSLALTGLLILGTHETSLFNLGGRSTSSDTCLLEANMQYELHILDGDAT